MTPARHASYRLTAALMRLTMWAASGRWRYRTYAVRALLPIVRLSHALMLWLTNA